MKSSMKTVAFIDRENLMGSGIEMDRKIDWPMLRKELACATNVSLDFLEVFVFHGLPPDVRRFRDKRQAILRRMRKCRQQGMFVIPREGAPHDDGYKSNVDVLLTVSCLLYAMDVNPDAIIVVSGDSDYRTLTDALRQRFGIRVYVASVDSNMSDDLSLSAHDVIDLKRYFLKCEKVSKRRKKLALADKQSGSEQTKISEIGEICKPAFDDLKKSHRTA